MLVCRRLVSRALLPTTGHRGFAMRCPGVAHVGFDLRWLTGDVARRACGVHDSLSVRSSLLQELLQPLRTPPLRRTRPTGFVRTLRIRKARIRRRFRRCLLWQTFALLRSATRYLKEIEASIAILLQDDGARSLFLAEPDHLACLTPTPAGQRAITFRAACRLTLAPRGAVRHRKFEFTQP